MVSVEWYAALPALAGLSYVFGLGWPWLLQFGSVPCDLSYSSKLALFI